MYHKKYTSVIFNDNSGIRYNFLGIPHFLLKSIFFLRVKYYLNKRKEYTMKKITISLFFFIASSFTFAGEYSVKGGPQLPEKKKLVKK